jgi:hypothetical protein
VENNIIALVIAMRNFLEGLNDTHLNSFLTDWPPANQDWTYRAAGLPIYHASGVPYAMRTETVPLLALYLWHGGNLVQKSRIE